MRNKYKIMNDLLKGHQRRNFSLNLVREKPQQFEFGNLSKTAVAIPRRKR